MNKKLENNIDMKKDIIDLKQKIDVIVQKLDNKNDNDNDNESSKSNMSSENNKKRTKADLFQKERKQFIEELKQHIGIINTNNSVLLYDLEKNEELKKYLDDKISDIQKYYKYSNWNYFINHKNKDLSILSLLKSIFKDEGFEVIKKKKLTEREGIKKQYILVSFIKKEQK